MSENINNGLEVLKYRVEQLESVIKPLIDLVNQLDKKIGLLTQKIVIATVLVGGVFQGLGVWYSVHGENKNNEENKISQYEIKNMNNDKLKEIEEQLRILKGEKK